MNRRRFLGEEKPKPLYLFQSGVGFIANPKEGVTLGHWGGSVRADKEYIRLSPKSSGEGTYTRDYLYVCMQNGASINFSNAFRGYKTLFIEAYNEDGGWGGTSMMVGISAKKYPDIGTASDWIQRREVSDRRDTIGFDIRGITSNINAVGGVEYVGGEKAYGRIYNIWLE